MRLHGLMASFEREGRLRVDPGDGGVIDPLFRAAAGSTGMTLQAIREFWQHHGYMLDPHSAVGVAVALKHLSPDEPMICLATAHPAKFPEAILRATGKDLAHHPELDALLQKPSRCDVMTASADALKSYIAGKIDARTP